MIRFYPDPLHCVEVFENFEALISTCFTFPPKRRLRDKNFNVALYLNVYA
jgi:hypothetical protein